MPQLAGICSPAVTNGFFMLFPLKSPRHKWRFIKKSTCSTLHIPLHCTDFRQSSKLWDGRHQRENHSRRRGISSLIFAHLVPLRHCPDSGRIMIRQVVRLSSFYTMVYTIIINVVCSIYFIKSGCYLLSREHVTSFCSLFCTVTGPWVQPASTGSSNF